MNTYKAQFKKNYVNKIDSINNVVGYEKHFIP